uniref:Uncharacterized protein n=1 Tax=Acrobeloides nanus TaxID=290746 RepID=A0A914CM33_9BILA
MLLQSWAICWEVFFVATVYCYNEFFPVPEILTKIEHTTWIFVHGDTPFVYLLLNKSLRSKFFQMLKNYTKSTGNTVAYFAPSVYPNQIAPRSPYLQATEINGLQLETRL